MTIMGYFFLPLLLLISTCHSLPTTTSTMETATKSEDQNYKMWLQMYGYMTKVDDNLGSLNSESSMSKSILKLQRFAGLQETGILDEDTKKLIESSRCGVPDFELSDNLQRIKRFVMQGTSWQNKKLTWRLTNDNNDNLSRKTVESILTKAFDKWAAHSTLTFTKMDVGDVDIRVSFNRGKHGDPYPFDGRGKVLAHAFYPFNNQGLAGDVHFDDDEEFTHKSLKGKNLYWIALHEIGHSLGLKHSSVKGAVMFPWYPGYTGKDLELSNDDIQGIQAIYGAVSPVTDAPTSTTKQSLAIKTEKSDTCLQNVKTVFLGQDSRTYVVNKDKLYIISKYLDSRKGPIAVSSYFHGIQTVDAGYKRFDGKVVLFSGKYFFLFDGKKKISGPNLISSQYVGFPSSISKIDAAFTWPANGRTYIFTGDLYWRYNHISQRIDYGYPRKIAPVWRGIPNNVDAVFSWIDGKTYFFQGSKYYQIRNSPVSVAYGFPKEITQGWMLCSADLRERSKESGSTIMTSSALLIISAVLCLRWSGVFW